MGEQLNTQRSNSLLLIVIRAMKRRWLPMGLGKDCVIVGRTKGVGGGCYWVSESGGDLKNNTSSV